MNLIKPLLGEEEKDGDGEDDEVNTELKDLIPRLNFGINEDRF